ncbi:MAG: hypothetical protein NTV54_10790 [Ignavibacteriales bacterium]|nr:hypothetical protein [Ignavibacteriales bacterium]
MKTNKAVVVCAAFALLLTASGCSTGGMFTAGNITDVQLQKSNFKIVARGVSGEAEVGYLFGASMSMGMVTQTFALVRIEGTGMLYKEALDNLWKNFEAAHGAVEGRKLALTNVRYDSDVLNLFVYTRPKVMVRADVIEFTE